ncbi:MAG: nucleotide exchange factor GrpE [Clostridiales bacterium]|nr:nucleotide exchange factor GrpE [Clostridiales bacterium]
MSKKKDGENIVSEADVNENAGKDKRPKSEKGKASAELERLEKELSESKESLLRMAAEYDNFRKRSAKEKEASYISAKSDVLKELLPVLDNFERAASNSSADAETYKKGVEMTYNQFLSIFEKLGAESFGEVGDVFDPLMHNAVMHTEDESLPENSVAAVFSKGYRMGDRILRCAAVQVAN